MSHRYYMVQLFILTLLSIYPPLTSTADAAVTQWLRFENPANVMENSVTGLSLGHLNGTGHGLVTDVMAPTIPLTSQQNTRSLRLTAGSWASITQQTFVFHAGQPAEATLEFMFKKTSSGGNQSIFWTRSNDSDWNRFNIFTGTTNYIHGDYREPVGTLHPISLGNHSYTSGTWIHVAIVRTISGGGHKYEWYFDGILDPALTWVDATPVLPTDFTWSIGGRGGLRYDRLIDEVRSSNEAPHPSEFLISPPPVSVKSRTWSQMKSWIK
jgi:hypothetical protein